jgi:hypothetical protein
VSATRAVTVGADLELELELDYVVLETKSVFFYRCLALFVVDRLVLVRGWLINHQSSNQSSFFYLTNSFSYCVYCTPLFLRLKKPLKQLSMIHN